MATAAVEIVAAFVDAGTDVVFGIPGSTISPLFDALHVCPRMRLVTSKHEAAATFAAAGWARHTGRIGAVWVTSGPGVLNAAVGLASATADSVPLVLIAGEVATAAQGRGALQDGSARGLGVARVLAPICKSVITVEPHDDPVEQVRRAMAIAAANRPGPVAVVLPVDLALRPATASRPPSVVGTTPADPRCIELAAAALSSAGRPMLLAGHGARAAAPALRRLAERLGIPVATSLKGKGVFPESHALSLGIFGHTGHPRAEAYVAGGIDVLMVVGCGLADTTTHGWTNALDPTDRRIQLDVDPDRIGRSYSVDIAVVGDARTSLPRILGAVGRRQHPPFALASERFIEPVGTKAAPGLLHPAQAVAELQAAMPDDAIYTVDIGEHMAFAAHYLQIDDPATFIACTGLASMGSGLGAAIGAQLACGPQRRVVSICGDGGLLMYLGELATCVEQRLPLTVAVFNDRRLNMVVQGARAAYGRTLPFENGPVDLAGAARCFGAHATVVDGPGQLNAELVRPRSPTIPHLIDIRIDPSVRLPSANARDPVRNHFAQTPEP